MKSLQRGANDVHGHEGPQGQDRQLIHKEIHFIHGSSRGGRTKGGAAGESVDDVLSTGEAKGATGRGGRDRGREGGKGVIEFVAAIEFCQGKRRGSSRKRETAWTTEKRREGRRLR